MSDFEYKAPPADGEAAPSETPMVEMAIGGKTYSIPAEMAEGINTERASVPSPANPQPVAAPVQHDEDAFWADPQAYITKQVQDGIKVAEQQINQRQAGKTAEQKFWKDFYGKNPHLKAIDSYVEHLAAQNVNKLKQFNGDTTKIANYIADLGNKEMHKFGKTPETSQVFVEGTPQPTTHLSQPTQTGTKNTTMGDVLRKRRDKRRSARLGT